MSSNLGFEASRGDFGLFTKDQRRIIIHEEQESNNNGISNISELNVKFNSLDGQIATLNNAIKTMETTLNQQINDQQVEITLNNLLANYQSVNTSFANLQIQVNSLNNQITSVKDNDIVVNNTVSVINSKLTQVSNDVSKSLNDIASLKLTDTNTNNSIITINAGINTINVSLAKVINDTSLLQSTVTSLLNSNETNVSDISNLKLKVLEFKNTIDLMNTSLSDMNIKVTNLNNLDIGQISSDIDSINNVIATLKQTDIAQLTLDNSAQGIDITTLKNTTSTIQTAINTINSTYTSFKSEYDATALLVEAHARAILDVETTAINTKNALKILNDKYVIDISALENNISLLLSADENINNSITNAHSDISLINDYLVILRAKIPAMQLEIDALKLVDTNTSSQFQTLTTNLDLLTTKVNGINLEPIATELLSVKTKVDNVATKNTTLETDISTIKSDLLLLQQALATEGNVDVTNFTNINEKLTLLQTKVQALENNPGGQVEQKRIDEIIQTKDIIDIVRMNGKLASIEYSEGYKEQYFYNTDKKISKVNYILNGVTKAYSTFEYVNKLFSKKTFTLMP